MKYFIGIASTILAISVTGCNSSKSNNAPSTTPTPTALNVITAKNADSEPSSIPEPSALEQDVSARFGGEDSDPLQLQKGESLSELLGRITP